MLLLVESSNTHKGGEKCKLLVKISERRDRMGRLRVTVKCNVDELQVVGVRAGAVCLQRHSSWGLLDCCGYGKRRSRIL
jgi:hypothetical protein